MHLHSSHCQSRSCLCIARAGIHQLGHLRRPSGQAILQEERNNSPLRWIQFHCIQERSHYHLGSSSLNHTVRRRSCYKISWVRTLSKIVSRCIRPHLRTAHSSVPSQSPSHSPRGKLSAGAPSSPIKTSVPGAGSMQVLESDPEHPGTSSSPEGWKQFKPHCMQKREAER